MRSAACARKRPLSFGMTRSAEVSPFLRRWGRSRTSAPSCGRQSGVTKEWGNEVSEAEESSQRPDPVVRDGGNRHSDRAGTGLQLQHIVTASTYGVEPELLARGPKGTDPQVRGDERALPGAV